ncbi:helix-turn-helix domain-containing protein [Clostridium sp. C8-1-8]|uniref:helix-turn-helix domain-containing protein n=1 Tax=Clostridium sp. C8-1-8 TaxID=2698831 RepID=UPI0013700887|nr:helix-turn-helix domain-containing protein [Clostridium sp. C8-1-8]
MKRWLKKYNSHREVKATWKGMNRSMIKARKTSLKEKIETVEYCISHNNDYQHTAEVYQVSYQQVYHWVRKYESGGENALKDLRGRKKSEIELTTEERMKIQIKKIGATRKGAFLDRLRRKNKYVV